jgi:hypothetical protein
MTAQPARSNRPVEVLSEYQCCELLASRDLGRIAFSIGDQPEILPINYAADGWDPQAQVGWSVVVKGVAEEVSSGIDPFSAALREHPVFPLAPGSRERWIAIYPAEISGRRFRLD